VSTEDQAWPEPRANPLLVGQEAAVATFLSACHTGKLPHAWLIAGPPGIGKASFAYRIARFALNGGINGGIGPAPEAGPSLFGDAPAAAGSLEVDPASTVFRQVAAASHPDLLTVERGINERTKKERSEIVVEDARRVAGFLHKTASGNGWRVVVIDSVDEMNRNAANAILKILEEPPANALLLLVSHSPGRLLPTIRSRCRLLRLSPLPETEMDRLLAYYLPGESGENRLLLTRLAEGSIGGALALHAAGGMALYRDLVGLLAALPDLEARKLHAFAGRFERAGTEAAFQTAMSLLADWIARLTRAKGLGQAPQPILMEEEAALWRLVTLHSLDRWLELWEKVRHLTARTDAINLDRKQVVIGAFLALQGAP
jgi:DNA polymerase-3 subunit delta'